MMCIILIMMAGIDSQGLLSQGRSPKRGGGTGRSGIDTHKIDIIDNVQKKPPKCIERWEDEGRDMLE